MTKQKSKEITIAGNAVWIYGLLFLIGGLRIISPGLIANNLPDIFMMFFSLFSFLMHRPFLSLPLGLIYIILGVNILQFKNWSRVFIIVISALIGLYCLYLCVQLFVLLWKDGFEFSGDNRFSFNFIWWRGIIPFFLIPSFLFLIFFTRSKIKEQFH